MTGVGRIRWQFIDRQDDKMLFSYPSVQTRVKKQCSPGSSLKSKVIYTPMQNSKRTQSPIQQQLGADHVGSFVGYEVEGAGRDLFGFAYSF